MSDKFTITDRTIQFLNIRGENSLFLRWLRQPEVISQISAIANTPIWNDIQKLSADRANLIDGQIFLS